MIKFISVITVIALAMSNIHAKESEKEVIKAAVGRLTQRQQEILRMMPPSKSWSGMDCYIRCIKMIESCCRLKMTGSKKNHPNGIFYAACPTKKCNYKNIKNKPEKHRKKLPGCTHYDKNGYWFVTFICNAHKRQWTFDMVRKYEKFDKNCPNFEVLRMEYFKNDRKLKELKKQI